MPSQGQPVVAVATLMTTSSTGRMIDSLHTAPEVVRPLDLCPTAPELATLATRLLREELSTGHGQAPMAAPRLAPQKEALSAYGSATIADVQQLMAHRQRTMTNSSFLGDTQTHIHFPSALHAAGPQA